MFKMISYGSLFFILLGTIVSSSSFIFAQSSSCSLPVPVNYYTSIGTLNVRNTTDISESYPYSIGTECMDRNYTIYDNWKDYLAPLGIKAARIQGGWYRCEPVKGEYDFNWLDSIVYGMIQNQNVIPWIQLSYGNPNYGTEGGTPESTSPLPNGTGLTGFLQWTTSIVTRYSSLVNTWEIWNEPEVGKITANNYAAFAIQVAQTIRSIQPNAIIRFGVLAGADVEYASAVLAIIKDQKSINLFNVLTYHPYAYNPDSVYEDVNNLQMIVQNISASLSIAQGENGAPSEPFTYGALGDYNWTECSQGKWISRRIVGDRSRNISTSTFTIVDICYITNNKSTINTKGIISANCPDKTIIKPKLAYGIVQRIVSTMDNRIVAIPVNQYTVQFVPVEDRKKGIPNSSSFSSSSMYTSLFMSNDRKNNILFSAWNASGTPTNSDETITNLYNVTITVDINAFYSSVGKNKNNAFSIVTGTNQWRLADILTGTVYSVIIDINQQNNVIIYSIPYVPVSDFVLLLGEESLLPII